MIKVLLKNIKFLLFKQKAQTIDKYADSSLAWLKDAQKNNKDGGIPAYFSLSSGYSNSYPETTGYLLKTITEAKKIFKDLIFEVDASEMYKFLINYQNKDGGWGHPDDFSESMIFDTGQVIEGLLSVSDEEFIFSDHDNHIIRAVNHIIERQNQDGSFNETAFIGKSYSYNSRVCAIIIECGYKFNNQKFVDSGIRGLDFILNKYTSNGWFDDVGNLLDENKPITHFVAYTLEGFIRGYISTGNEIYLKKVVAAMDNINITFEKENKLTIALDSNWNNIGNSQLLTGLSQLAIINWILFKITSIARYKSLALRMNNNVKEFVDLNDHTNQGVYGGVPSCAPFSKKYYYGCYLNWATKFFIDALVYEKLNK